MDIVSINREAWDHQVKSGCQWTVPVSPDEVTRARAGDLRVVLTPMKPVPRDWFPKLQACKVLGLACGGGQQGPLLSASGADVTIFDNSPSQLAQDQMVAKREGLVLQTELGDMNDLSRFADETFDLIFHPCSLSFVPNVRPVFGEVFRVLKRGGCYLLGFCNPLLYIFDYEKYLAGEFDVRHPIPYSDVESLTASELAVLRAQNEPLCFGHRLADLLGGQTDAGFQITGFYEDKWGGDKENLLDDYLATMIATRAVKPALSR